MRRFSPSPSFAISIVLAACGSKAPPAATAEERKAALDVLEPMVEAFSPGDPDGNTQHLVQAIKALPQFANAGSSPDGTVWAAFKGGVLLFIVPIAPPDQPAGPAPPPPPARPARSTLRSASLGTVPKSDRARLLNGLGSLFSDLDMRPEVLGMLQANGYTGVLDEATVDKLRTSVSGDGIFYYRTHGGQGEDLNGNQVYALWTATPVYFTTREEILDETLLDDLGNQRVVYMLFRNDIFTRVLPADWMTANRHYGITDKFVSTYMSFADNSLVYIDACDSAKTAALRDAFKSKNGSLFVGWDERAWMSAGGKTAKYVFDRLLGANKFVPEDPPQRPFPYDALAQDQKFGKGKAYGYSTATLSNGTPIAATLGFYPLAGQFGILAPGIYGMQVSEADDELMLVGSFGPCALATGCTPGTDAKVIIDGGGGEVALAVKDWSTDGMTIKAGLPRTGSGSFGNVVVTVRGHRSNTRQLIAWDGTFTHTLKDAGTLTQRFELDMRLRVDPHEVRNSPGEAPHPTPFKQGATNLGMAARWEAAGTYTQPAGNCTFTYDWSGTGAIPANATFSGRSYIYSGSVDVQRGVASLSAQAMDLQGGLNKSTQVCPPPAGTISYTNPLGVTTVFPAFYARGAVTLDLPLDGTLNISADTRQGLQAGSFGGQATLTLQWPAMPAQPPYDGTLPR